MLSAAGLGGARAGRRPAPEHQGQAFIPAADDF